MNGRTATRHPGVAHADISRSGAFLTGQQLSGRLLLGDGLTATVRIGDHTLDVEWGLPSPGLHRELPGVAGADRARFVTTYPPELSGRARLLVLDAHGEHEVASCPVPALPGPERRMAVADVRARVEQLLCGAAPEPDEHVRLHRSLAATPVPVRDADWLETLVLLNTRFRAQGGNTFSNLEVLRGLLGPESFAGVWQRCAAAMHPDTLTQHGYAPGLASWEPDQVWAEVGRVAATVSELGHPVLVASGTLLGLVRDGRPIPHDYDADLVVVVPGQDARAAVDSFWHLKEQLADAGHLFEEYEREGRAHARVISPAGLPVDLFPAWIDAQDRAHVWPTVHGELPASALLPATARPVGGVELPLPRDPDRVLTANYGSGWRDPDPLFSFPWAQARARFPDFIEANAARRRTSRWPAPEGLD